MTDRSSKIAGHAKAHVVESFEVRKVSATAPFHSYILAPLSAEGYAYRDH